MKKIGMEGNFDTEIIIASQPDIIFVSPNRRGGYEVMKELNIPLVPYWAFKETSPLGLSEWIKVAGMFIGKEEEACQLFAQMEQRYNLLKAKVSNVKQRPSVFSGEMRRDTWYVPGGQSFYARLFVDAGADYFMKDNPETGGVLMDFETVYAQGYNAGYWRVMNGYKGEFSYEALKASNPQYADFRAFKEKKVIYCNLEWIPLYENLPLSPDVLLSDMIKAFHPELLPDYHPVFYSLLEKE
ncbi:ABC transporter substrate-binding protein [Phocaeicola vulgatus]|nr:ABC transporter substrate-binding protein [Phocaeicola vulgatus]MDB0942726.1 ABC transporter substrate-binding protein [Phocaeicola vulgatus]MDB0947524.1 ABC transporter substrate-binding protein [Phocaeicola vulgatus]MDB0951814.1 ABC transporter substrate-binding protein [Phocaeicola vulgatus]MDB0956188.1 ABC transporter substrate-binding protein [Phocaeicola vulgatus]